MEDNYREYFMICWTFEPMLSAVQYMDTFLILALNW
jgi:hypothetical protein